MNFCRSVSSSLSFLNVLGDWLFRNLFLRESWVGSKVVAGIKTILFAIFDPIWNYILAPKDPNKELFEQNFSFQLIRKMEVILSIS